MVSVMNGSHHVLTTKSILFMESKDEWDTKKDTGKSKIKPIALAIVELHESEGIRQLFSKSVSQ